MLRYSTTCNREGEARKDLHHLPSAGPNRVPRASNSADLSNRYKRRTLFAIAATTSPGSAIRTSWISYEVRRSGTDGGRQSHPMHRPRT